MIRGADISTSVAQSPGLGGKVLALVASAALHLCIESLLLVLPVVLAQAG